MGNINDCDRTPVDHPSSELNEESRFLGEYKWSKEEQDPKFGDTFNELLENHEIVLRDYVDKHLSEDICDKRNFGLAQRIKARLSGSIPRHYLAGLRSSMVHYSVKDDEERNITLAALLIYEVMNIDSIGLAKGYQKRTLYKMLLDAAEGSDEWPKVITDVVRKLLDTIPLDEIFKTFTKDVGYEDWSHLAFLALRRFSDDPIVVTKILDNCTRAFLCNSKAACIYTHETEIPVIEIILTDLRSKKPDLIKRLLNDLITEKKDRKNLLENKQRPWGNYVLIAGEIERIDWLIENVPALREEYLAMRELARERDEKEHQAEEEARQERILNLREEIAEREALLMQLLKKD